MNSNPKSVATSHRSQLQAEAILANGAHRFHRKSSIIRSLAHSHFALNARYFAPNSIHSSHLAPKAPNPLPLPVEKAGPWQHNRCKQRSYPVQNRKKRGQKQPKTAPKQPFFGTNQPFLRQKRQFLAQKNRSVNAPIASVPDPSPRPITRSGTTQLLWRRPGSRGLQITRELLYGGLPFAPGVSGSRIMRRFNPSSTPAATPNRSGIAF